MYTKQSVFFCIDYDRGMLLIISVSILHMPPLRFVGLLLTLDQNMHFTNKFQYYVIRQIDDCVLTVQIV